MLQYKLGIVKIPSFSSMHIQGSYSVVVNQVGFYDMIHQMLVSMLSGVVPRDNA
jgi:hypothetical protein